MLNWSKIPSLPSLLKTTAKKVFDGKGSYAHLQFMRGLFIYRSKSSNFVLHAVVIEIKGALCSDKIFRNAIYADLTCAAGNPPLKQPHSGRNDEKRELNAEIDKFEPQIPSNPWRFIMFLFAFALKYED